MCRQIQALQYKSALIVTHKTHSECSYLYLTGNVSIFWPEINRPQRVGNCGTSITHIRYAWVRRKKKRLKKLWERNFKASFQRRGVNHWTSMMAHCHHTRSKKVTYRIINCSHKPNSYLQLLRCHISTRNAALRLCINVTEVVFFLCNVCWIVV